jgi:Tol biopolymer transport system component
MRRGMTVLSGLAAAGLVASVAAPVAGASAAKGDRPPPSGGLIVWTNRSEDGSSEHLMIARGDGSNPHSLTPAVDGVFDVNAQVSPRGVWIAYEHNFPEGAEVRLVRPSGARDHALDVGCAYPCVAVAAPTWLSNKRLAFTLVRAPFDEQTGLAASAVLWTAKLDGSELHRISRRGIDGTYEDSRASIARDRDYLTFARIRNADGRWALFRAHVDGSHAQQLTPWDISTAEVYDLSTASSGPTKDLIVFESYGRGDFDATFADIATVPATCGSLAACTAKIHWITDNEATGRRNANPQWSPDGSSIVFTDRSSIDEPNAEIWTMRYPSGSRRLISTSSPNFDYRPTWGRLPAWR